MKSRDLQSEKRTAGKEINDGKTSCSEKLYVKVNVHLYILIQREIGDSLYMDIYVYIEREKGSCVLLCFLSLSVYIVLCNFFAPKRFVKGRRRAKRKSGWGLSI